MKILKAFGNCLFGMFFIFIACSLLISLFQIDVFLPDSGLLDVMMATSKELEEILNVFIIFACVVGIVVGLRFFFRSFFGIISSAAEFLFSLRIRRV